MRSGKLIYLIEVAANRWKQTSTAIVTVDDNNAEYPPDKLPDSITYVLNKAGYEYSKVDEKGNIYFVRFGGAGGPRKIVVERSLYAQPHYLIHYTNYSSIDELYIIDRYPDQWVWDGPGGPKPYTSTEIVDILKGSQILEYDD